MKKNIIKIFIISIFFMLINTVFIARKSYALENTYNGFTVVGNIEIPKISVNLPILKEITSSALQTSVVLLYGDGINQVGNNVIMGHNFRNGTHFSNLSKLENGDSIKIKDMKNNTINYKVYKTETTTPTNTSYYNRNTNGKKEITLSTTTDDGTNRFVVFALETTDEINGSDNSSNSTDKNNDSNNSENSTDKIDDSNNSGNSTDKIDDSNNSDNSTDKIDVSNNSGNSTDKIDDSNNSENSTDKIDDSINSENSTDKIDDSINSENSTDKIDDSNNSNNSTDKIDDSNTNGNSTNKNNNDSTVSKTKLPKTGKNLVFIVFFLLTSICSIISYIKLKKYKNY